MTVNATYYAGPSYAPTDMLQREADWVSPGVLSVSDLVVAQTATASMAVTVSGASQGTAGGNAWLPNGYRVYNDTQATLIVLAADATNPRIDLVAIGIDTTTNPYTPEVMIIKGTAAASPVVPSYPTGFVGLSLAKIAVAANATSIVNANITDLRVIAGMNTNALSDQILQTVGGTATVLTVPMQTLVNGYRKAFIAASNNNAAGTTLNGLPFYKPGGTSAPNLIAGKAYEAWYNAATPCFFIKASAEGNTIASHVLAGETFSTDIDTGLVGTAVLKSGITYIPTTTDQTITAGHEDGTCKVKGDANLVTANIRAGTSIFGVPGKSSVVETSSSTATAGVIRSGYSAYVNGSLITGILANHTNALGTQYNAGASGSISIFPPAGYWASDQITYLNDANYIASNIISGISIFGLAGTATITSLGGYKYASGTVAASGGSGQTLTTGFTTKYMIIKNRNLTNGGGQETLWVYVSDANLVYELKANSSWFFSTFAPGSLFSVYSTYVVAWVTPGYTYDWYAFGV